ncbi:hypothetical protein LTR37_019111 [Vermiconidia calcicola]|uniref:Uncharacterized protein n=1 Tax=Vermiconidia calcicola TaxID=1690605 RepID=A0ACC3MF37_9PEZI|nr:hypothetical protein LTR37_019111 [Vermiconidia calcicola]
MANGANASPGLSFSRETFAKLTPAPFLHAHLKQNNSVRPNGRSPEEFRQTSINSGSLTHSNGSAVVRCGDTAVVCGVRAEILLASDIPHSPGDDIEDDDLIEEVGLLVPNLEMSTGCSPAHLPGNPPGTLAQSLSYRISSLLHLSNIVNPDDLRIQYTEPKTDEDLPDEGPKQVTKAYWTLYIDILCIALDGNAFDTAWAATIAAFQNTTLPKAWWDPDREMVVCSPRSAEANSLRLNCLPAASTFGVFSTISDSFVLADPDAFEEDLADETVTVVVASSKNRRSSLLSVQKGGGAVVGKYLAAKCILLAEDRRS